MMTDSPVALGFSPARAALKAPPRFWSSCFFISSRSLSQTATLRRSRASVPLALRFRLATVLGRSGFGASAEVVSTVDECEMRERLRKISELPVFFGIVLFRQKADIVAQ